MNLHLDTNVIIEMLNGRRPDFRARYERYRRQGDDVSVSSIVVFELWYGIAKSNRVAENAGGLRLLLDTMTALLPFSVDDAIAAGELRATLDAAGTPIGPYDLLIAAHALRANATLVTANVREFSCVPGLKIEDWAV